MTAVGITAVGMTGAGAGAGTTAAGTTGKLTTRAGTTGAGTTGTVSTGVGTGTVSIGVGVTGGVAGGGVASRGVTTGGVTIGAGSGGGVASGGVMTGGASAGGVTTGGAAVGAMKLLVIVAVHVTVLAPVLPEPSHCLIVVGSPVLCDGGAVVVHVRVPPAPPESLHWSTVWPPGPPVPGWLSPGGVAVHVRVPTVPGFWHCVTVASLAEPVGYPVRLLVTVAVHVTVLAAPRPVPLHWSICVTGVGEVVVVPDGQTADPVHWAVVTIVAMPVG